jgi:hypothetical protein
MQYLDWFYSHGDFIDDAAEAVDRADNVQEFGIRCFGSLSEIARRRDPLHSDDIRTDLAKFDTVESVFAVTACG